MQVLPITKRQAELFVTTKHYSRRPSIFWAAFGLVEGRMVTGVVVYGQPSPPIQKHAFRERDFKLYELTRLVVQSETKNAASFLVGRSLRLLEKPSAVVSYADTEWGHCGIIYQATNWLYTGATKSHDHAYLIDGKRVHPMTLRDMGVTDPKRWAKENGVATAPPMFKHRYFYANGSATQKREILARLNYPIVTSYPKLDKSTYDAGANLALSFDDKNALCEGLF